MAKKTITIDEFDILRELHYQAKYLNQQLDKLIDDAEEITGEEHGGATFDYIANSKGTAAVLMDVLEIEVKNV